MSHQYLLFYILLFIIYDVNTLSQNIRLTKFENCDPATNYPLSFFVKFRFVKTYQLFDYNATFTIPFAYNATADLHIAVAKNGKNFMHLLTLRGDDICQFHRKYLGELHGIMLQGIGLRKDQCPIPKGTYLGKNLKVDFSHLPVYAIPTGVLSIRQIVQHKYTKKILSCINFDFTNN